MGGPRSVWPDRHQWGVALSHAVRSPATWVPAAGAALVAPWDSRISDWAVRTTPVFGSPEHARTTSDLLRLGTDVGMLATALLPSPDEGGHGPVARVLVGELGAVASTSLARGLKVATRRNRPDGSDNESFPSGHSTRAFAYQALSWRNVEASGLSAPARWATGIGLGSLAASCAWARVEAGVHYPSDVLAGAAVGNFVATLIHDAFLGSATTSAMDLVPDPEGPGLGVRIRF
jgi:membrane-associated phospholipid phosphatase